MVLALPLSRKRLNKQALLTMSTSGLKDVKASPFVKPSLRKEADRIIKMRERKDVSGLRTGLEDSLRSYRRRLR